MLKCQSMHLKELYSGMALAIFVYIFSLCVVITKFSSFRESGIAAITCNCRTHKNQDKKKDKHIRSAILQIFLSFGKLHFFFFFVANYLDSGRAADL